VPEITAYYTSKAYSRGQLYKQKPTNTVLVKIDGGEITSEANATRAFKVMLNSQDLKELLEAANTMTSLTGCVVTETSF
jgi:hypothetical protein